MNAIADQFLIIGSIPRDAPGHFVANPSSTWSLTARTAGVLSSVLAPTSGARPALTGHAVGAAAIHAVNGSLNGNCATQATFSVMFTPTDTVPDNPADATLQINVAKATPTLTWGNPSAIV